MSGILSFDPDAFVARTVAPARPKPLFETPDAWRHGLELLADRAPPPGMRLERWAEILADSTKIATIWAPKVLAAGWSIEELFGLDPVACTAGLAVGLRGRPLVSVDSTPRTHLSLRHRYASMRDGEGFAWCAADMPVGSPLLWTFDARELTRP